MNAIESIKKWLTFGLSKEQEDRFRKVNFGADIAQARICILLVILTLLVFEVNDYGLLGLSWSFYGLLAVRIALVAYTIVLLKSLPRLTNYRSYDRAEFVWGLCIAIFAIATAATRPTAFIAHIIVVFLAVFITVLAIPNRFTNQLTVSIVYIAGETLVLVHSLWMSPAAYVTALLSLFLAISIAIASGWLLHSSRRREFLAHEEGQKARVEAETQLAECKQAEKALKKSEEQYRTLFSTMNEGFCIIEMLFDENEKPIDYIFIKANPAFENQTGLSNVVGKKVRELIPTNEEYWYEICGKVALTGESVRFENHVEALHRWYEVYTYRIGQPECWKVAIIFNDITERKKAKAKLKETLDNLENLVKERTGELEMAYSSLKESETGLAEAQRITHVGNWDWDIITNESHWSDEIYRILGCEPQEFRATRNAFLSYIHPEDQKYWNNAVKEALNEKPFHIDYRIVLANGEERIVHTQGGAIFGEKRIPVRLTGTVQDITERKKAEETLKLKLEELHRSNAELEQFAYVSSHDLQEPLRMISSYLQLLQRRYQGNIDDKADKYINFAVDGAFRMQNLINDLLEFSRVTTRAREPEPVDCESVLNQVLSNLDLYINENKATVSYSYLPEVMADNTQLAQVFQNLIINCINFHSEEAPKVHISAEEKANEWQFSVRDNGIGIDQQYSEKIFEVL